MIRPAKGVISQGFSAAHQAIDIANKPGTPVVAPISGEITIAGDLGECGLGVQVGDTTNGHRMCHNRKLLVKVGDIVKEGQKVAEMGYTGLTVPDDVPEGSHLHWVMWKDGKRVDGEKYLKEDDMFKGKSAEYWYKQTQKYKGFTKSWRVKYQTLVKELKKLTGGK